MLKDKNKVSNLKSILRKNLERRKSVSIKNSESNSNEANKNGLIIDKANNQ